MKFDGGGGGLKDGVGSLGGSSSSSIPGGGSIGVSIGGGGGSTIGGTVGTGSGIFVSQKISRIRWKPRNDTSSTLMPELFLTGSWDDQQHNKVALWQCSRDSPLDEPKLAMSISHAGDVNDLQFTNSQCFATASSTGSVHLYQLVKESSSANNPWKIVLTSTWDKIHTSKHGSSSSNGISCNGDNIVSVGEDGRIFLLNAKQKSPIKTYENADSCSLTAVKFVKHDEIISANMRGQMKLWDLRSSQNGPSATFFLSNTDQIGITSIAKHPTQSHVLCTGSQDGMLAIWDLRSGAHPVTLLNAHKQPVSEVQFHHQQPDHIFSCSQNGDIWHWDASAITRANLLHYGNQQTSMTSISTTSTYSSPWLSSEAIKHKVESHALMSKQSLPINSLDSFGSSIIFAGDNEAIYLFPSVIL